MRVTISHPACVCKSECAHCVHGCRIPLEGAQGAHAHADTGMHTVFAWLQEHTGRGWGIRQTGQEEQAAHGTAGGGGHPWGPCCTPESACGQGCKRRPLHWQAHHVSLRPHEHLCAAGMPVYFEENSVMLLHCASAVKMPARVLCPHEHHHVRRHCN